MTVNTFAPRLIRMDYISHLQQLAKRNAAIKKFSRLGHSKTAIARHFKISRARVYQVLAK